MIKNNSANTFKALSTAAFFITISVVMNSLSNAEQKLENKSMEEIAVTAFEMPESPAVSIEGADLLVKRAAKLYRPTVSGNVPVDVKSAMLAKSVGTPWTRLSTIPSLPISDVIESKDAISIETSTVMNTQVGNEVEVTLPGDLQYMVLVNKKDAGSWSGYVEGYDQQYPVVFTVSKASVFATITTPEGSFTVETIDGEGWVYQNPNMSELSHADSEDFLLPSHDHHHADA